MADSEMLGILLPKTIKRKLEDEAVKRGLKVSTHVRTILIEHLQSKKRGKKASA